MPSPLRDLFAGRIGGRRAVETKRIHQAELERAMDEVVDGRGVMQQSLFGDAQPSTDDRLMQAVEAAAAARLGCRAPARIFRLGQAGGGCNRARQSRAGKVFRSHTRDVVYLSTDFLRSIT